MECSTFVEYYDSIEKEFIQEDEPFDHEGDTILEVVKNAIDCHDAYRGSHMGKAEVVHTFNYDEDEEDDTFSYYIDTDLLKFEELSDHDKKNITYPFKYVPGFTSMDDSTKEQKEYINNMLSSEEVVYLKSKYGTFVRCLPLKDIKKQNIKFINI